MVLAASEGCTRDFLVAIGQPPNMRLKLAGADHFKGTGVLCLWRGTACGQHPCARGRFVRSLSAIR